MEELEKFSVIVFIHFCDFYKAQEAEHKTNASFLRQQQVYVLELTEGSKEDFLSSFQAQEAKHKSYASFLRQQS